MFLSTPSLESKVSVEDMEFHLLQALNFSHEGNLSYSGFASLSQSHLKMLINDM